MNETQSFFIKILSSYVNKEKLYVPDTVDWQQILYLSEIHNVQVIIYLVLKDFEEKPPILDELHQRFLMAVNVATLQEAYTEDVLSKFDEVGIGYTLFKGYLIRDYYQDKEARSFGDIDILIDEKNRDKSDQVIKGKNFLFDKENYVHEVWPYTKGPVHLEVHTHIIYQKLFNEFDYISYFDKKCKDKVQVYGNRYKLKDEDHFIYLVVHLAKHFYNAGVGIRMFMDFAVFVKRLSLDFEYINSELKDIGLADFVNTVYSLCNTFFDSKIDCKPIQEDKETILISYILNHGVFGFENQDFWAVSLNNNDENESITGNLFKRVFRDYDYMVRFYPWFANGKKYQLPYAWIRRIIEQLFCANSRKQIRYKLKAIVSPNDDAQKHYQMLKIVGLK